MNEYEIVRNFQKKIDIFLKKSEQKFNKEEALHLLKNANRFLKRLSPPLKNHESSLFKKIIISQFRDQMWIIDEVTVEDARFDLIGIEKRDKKRIVGFEIKVSKQDLLNDNKFENYLNYCNVLYFVVPPKLVEIAREKLSDYPSIGIYCIENDRVYNVKKAVKINKSKVKKKEVKKKIFQRAYNKSVYNF